MRDVNNKITPSFAAGCQSPSLTKSLNYPFRSHFELFHSWPRNDSIYVSNLQLLPPVGGVMLLPVIVIMAHKLQQEKKRKRKKE